jgi:hypothetical protein
MKFEPVDVRKDLPSDVKKFPVPVAMELPMETAFVTAFDMA